MAEIQDGDHGLVLCHYPMIAWNGAGRGALQLFGHIHDHWAGSRNSVNVGVNQWGFRPIQIGEIAKRAARMPVNKHWADVEHGNELIATWGNSRRGHIVRRSSEVPPPRAVWCGSGHSFPIRSAASRWPSASLTTTAGSGSRTCATGMSTAPRGWRFQIAAPSARAALTVHHASARLANRMATLRRGPTPMAARST